MDFDYILIIIILFILGVYYYTKYKNEKRKHINDLILNNIKETAYYFILYSWLFKIGNENKKELTDNEKLDVIMFLLYSLGLKTDDINIQLVNEECSSIYKYLYLMPKMIEQYKNECKDIK